MFNLDDLKNLKATTVNSTSNGVAFREISNDELKEALVGEAIEYMAKATLPENPSAAQENAFGLAQIAENSCDTSADVGALIIRNINSVAERLHLARARDNAKAISNAEAAGQGICNFIKRLQTNIGRNSFYRTLEAERYETAGADSRFNTKSDYDGYQNVTFTPLQVAEVVDEIYDEFTAVYGCALNVCSGYIQDKMATFPFVSIPRGNNVYDEYFSREELYNALRDNKAVEKADNKETRGLLVS